MSEPIDHALSELRKIGVLIEPSDMPGLYCGAAYPELTRNQVLSIAANLVPAMRARYDLPA